jgi:glycosyltransferase involved in cell wall biosynthesis
MISFIVPAFNEVDNIGPTIESICHVAELAQLELYEIIVVDDGSTDGTRERVDTLRKQHQQVTSISHSTNLGLGAAIRSGLGLAKHPRFMVVPGDNDIQQDLLLFMLTFRQRADLVLIVPLNNEIRTLGRNILSSLYRLIYMVSFNIYVNYVNGPGIWPTELARTMDLRANRFSIVSELVVKLLRSGCSYVEIPGYLQAGPKVRRTVTMRNLLEVVSSYFFLLYEIHVRSRRKFACASQRVFVNFVDVDHPPTLVPRRIAAK